MDIVGSLTLKGLGQIKNARIENVLVDPLVPSVGQVWYNVTDGVYRGYDGTAVMTFASGGNTAVLLAEIDAIETATGLNTDGTLPSLAATNYLTGKTNLFDTIIALDTKAKALTDALATTDSTASTLATKVGNVVTAEGLNTDGTFAALTGSNYATAATTAREVDLALDTQIKTNADAIATNASAIDTKVAKAGDTMTGNLAFGGISKVTGLAAPDNAGDAANKAYVDALAAGLTWENAVDGVVTDKSTIATALTAGQRFEDSVDDKIYTVTTDGADGATAIWNAGEALVSGAAFFDKSTETGYVFNGTEIVQFTGAYQVVAGTGLVKTGNVLDINMGAGISQLPTDEVGIDVLSAGALFLTVDGSTASTDTAAQLSVKLDASTLTRTSSGLKVSSAGVTEVELAASVAGAGLTGGAGAALAVAAGTGIVVADDTVQLDLTYADGRYLNTSGDTLTGALITAGAPTVDLEVSNKAYVDLVKAALDASTFVYVGGTAATSHTVTHNLGTQYCQVLVVDSADKQILPDTVTFDSTTGLTVTFSSAITCKVVVTGKFIAA